MSVWELALPKARGKEKPEQLSLIITKVMDVTGLKA
jgi:hypothetical protein